MAYFLQINCNNCEMVYRNDTLSNQLEISVVSQKGTYSVPTESIQGMPEFDEIYNSSDAVSSQTESMQEARIKQQYFIFTVLGVDPNSPAVDDNPEFFEFTVPFTTDYDFMDNQGYLTYGFFSGHIESMSTYLDVKRFLNNKEHDAVIVAKMK